MDPNRIRQRRKERGLSQFELAQQLHISRKKISQWERGEQAVELEMLLPLANALGVMVEDLLLETEQLDEKEREAFRCQLREMLAE